MIVLNSIFSCILIFLSSLGIGNLFFEFIKLKHKYILIFKITIGLGLLSYFILVLGLLNFLFYKTILISLIIFSLTNIFFLQKFFLKKKIKNIFIKKIKFNLVSVLFILILFVFILTVFEVLTPALSADSIRYHMRIPLDYIYNNNISYFPNVTFNSPHLIQLIYTIPLFLKATDIGINFFNFYILMIFLIVLFCFSRNFYNLKISLIFILIILSTPIMTYIKVTGKIDLALSLFTLMSIYAAFISFCQSDEDDFAEYKWIFVSGAFIGIACNIKYYGLFSLVSIFFILILHNFKSKKIFLHKLKIITFFLIAVIIFGSPFYIKNFYFTGNPIFPAMYDIFGGLNWSAELNEAMKNITDDAKRPLGDSFKNLIVSPWLLIMNGKITNSDITGYGFLYLSIIPFIIFELFLRKSRPYYYGNQNFNLINYLFLFCIVFWVLWYYFAFQRGRHLFLVFTLLSLYISIFINKWIRLKPLSINSKIIRYGIILNLTLFITVNLFISIYYSKKFIPVAFNSEEKKRFIYQKRPVLTEYQKIDNYIPKNAKVLHLFGYNQFYLKRDQFYPSPIFQGLVDWTKMKNVNDYRDFLLENDFTHIVGDINLLKNYISYLNNQLNYNYAKVNFDLLSSYSDLLYSKKIIAPKSKTLNLGFNEFNFQIYKIK